MSDIKPLSLPERLRYPNRRMRERMNIYDCLFYGSGPHRRGLTDSSQRLFGCANIGNLAMTNIAHPGMFPADQTALITNWYARTNIPEGALRDALGELAIVTLTIGTRPMWQGTLHDLFRRKPGDGGPWSDDPAKAEGERQDLIYHLARIGYDAIPDAAATAAGYGQAGTAEALGDLPELPEAEIQSLIPGVEPLLGRLPFDALPEVERARWYEAASAMFSELRPSSVIVVPVRQCFGVVVDIFNLVHLNKAIIALDDPSFDAEGNRIHLLSAPAGCPADRPGVWIHLEGWVTREIL